MNINIFVSKLREIATFGVFLSGGTFAVGFCGCYIVDINDNDTIVIRRKTDLQQIEEELVTIKTTFEVLQNKIIAKKEPKQVTTNVFPLYFPKTEEIMTFDISQCNNKTAIDLINASKIPPNYIDEVKPILTFLLEAYHP